MRLPKTIPAAAVALGAFAFANPALAAPATVAVANHNFNPDPVTVNTGDAVNWDFQENGHNVDVVSGPETFRNQTGTTSSGTQFSHTFAKPGTYKYICDFHSGMSGTITVVSAPSQPAAGGGGAAGGGSASGQPAAAGSSQQATTGGGANGLSPATALGSASPTAVDAAAPAVKARGFKANKLRLELSKDSRIVLRYVRVGAPGHVVHKEVTTAKKGTATLDLSRWMKAGRYRIHVLAFDQGGNVSRPMRMHVAISR
jgi:plastocyanin